MKIYLDAIRTPPSPEWCLVTNFEDCVCALDLFWDEITDISLCYNLPETKTGLDVMKHIQAKTEYHGYDFIPVVHVHSEDEHGTNRINNVLKYMLHYVTGHNGDIPYA